MPIIWNPKTRRYIRSGRTLPPESVRRFVLETVGLARVRLTTIAENYIDHRNVAQWFTGTKAELRAMHTALGMIAQGGKAQMTPKSWGKVGQMVRSEMDYLRQFERGVANGAVSDAQLLARVLGYGDAGYKIYSNMVKAREAEAGMFARRVTSGGPNTCDDCFAAELEGWVPADEVREIGDSQCVCVTTPDSRVLTDRGWIAIALVEPGDYVWTHRARWQRVLKTTISLSRSSHTFASVKAPTGREIGFTSDHKLLTPQGWRSLNIIVHDDLLVYNWQYELLQKLQQRNAEEAAERVPLSPMPTVPLWEGEGLPSEGMQVVRDESHGEGSVGGDPSNDVGFDQSFSQAASTSLPRLNMGVKLATQNGGWSLGYSVLGWKLAETHLPLSMGMAASARPNSKGLRDSSQERRSDVRFPLELGTQNEVGSLSTSRYRETSEDGQDAMPGLQDGLSSQEAFSYEVAEVLLSGVRETPVPLWDLEVEADHSFIVEGIVAHNSSCLCDIEYAESEGAAAQVEEAEAA